MKRMSNEDFIRKSKEIWGNKYDYSLVEYKNMKTKIKVIYNDWIFLQNAEDHLLGKMCELRWDTDRFVFESKKIHGEEYDYCKAVFKNMNTKVILLKDGIEYLQSPNKHLMGRKPERVRRLRSNADFIDEARSIWGYKYDYSLVDYKGSHIEVLIKYDDVVYRQKPVLHLLGYNCERDTIKNQEDFLRKCYDRHGDKYDYSLVEYTGSQNKVKIIFEGKVYEQKAGAHIHSSGLVERVILKKTTKQFIKEANEIHNFRYDYSKVEYVNNQTKVTIGCLIHGDFEQVSTSHLSGTGCPHCSESKGEKKISKFLDLNEIKYVRQKKFDGCVGIRYKLPFDFYLPKYRTAIEFDGIQHYEPIPYFGGLEAYDRLKKNDKIKSDYCEENYIDLIRIRYDQIDRVFDILKESLKNKVL
jgi:very-short-patch-repair endonuclease